MFNKEFLYTGAQAVWFLVSVVAVVVVYTGNAEPYLAASQLPGASSASPELSLAGIGIGLVLAGVVPIQLLKTRAWNRMGAAAGLTPDGGGIVGKPALTGSVRGRPVRARLTKRKVSSGDRGSSHVTYTVVEADLAEPTDVGLMIGRKPAGESAGKTDLGDVSVRNVAVGDRFVVVGGDDDGLARGLLTEEAQRPLLGLRESPQVTVGDPTDTIMDAVPDLSGSFIGGMAQNKLEAGLQKRLPGSSSTVAIETKGVLLDPDELEQRVAAVSAVADAFEGATAGIDRA